MCPKNNENKQIIAHGEDDHAIVVSRVPKIKINTSRNNFFNKKPNGNDLRESPSKITYTWLSKTIFIILVSLLFTKYFAKKIMFPFRLYFIYQKGNFSLNLFQPSTYLYILIGRRKFLSIYNQSCQVRRTQEVMRASITTEIRKKVFKISAWMEIFPINFIVQES